MLPTQARSNKVTRMDGPVTCSGGRSTDDEIGEARIAPLLSLWLQLPRSCFFPANLRPVRTETTQSGSTELSFPSIVSLLRGA